jgi:hypothetical protein
MEAQEAIKKIDEINAVIRASNKALFSGRHMALYGIMLLLVPIIGYLTKWLTFGFNFGSYHAFYTAITNTAFFWGLALLIKRVVPRTDAYQKSRQNIHPLIEKAFSISRPIVLSIVGLVVILSLTHQSQYIYPTVLILLGIMFSIFGKFSIRAVSYIAWSLIACGLLHMYLIPYDIPRLEMYFLFYNGFAYLLMGFALSREEKVNAE